MANLQSDPVSVLEVVSVHQPCSSRLCDAASQANADGPRDPSCRLITWDSLLASGAVIHAHREDSQMPETLPPPSQPVFLHTVYPAHGFPHNVFLTNQFILRESSVTMGLCPPISLALP